MKTFVAASTEAERIAYIKQWKKLRGRLDYLLKEYARHYGAVEKP